MKKETDMNIYKKMAYEPTDSIEDKAYIDGWNHAMNYARTATVIAAEKKESGLKMCNQEPCICDNCAKRELPTPQSEGEEKLPEESRLTSFQCSVECRELANTVVSLINKQDAIIRYLKAENARRRGGK